MLDKIIFQAVKRNDEKLFNDCIKLIDINENGKLTQLIYISIEIFEIISKLDIKECIELFNYIIALLINNEIEFLKVADWIKVVIIISKKNDEFKQATMIGMNALVQYINLYCASDKFIKPLQLLLNEVYSKAHKSVENSLINNAAATLLPISKNSEAIYTHVFN